MTLATYLNAKANLHAREELINYRLLFDTKLAAAAHGYHLLTYYSDVDHDGFDIIFDDHHTVRKVQLKTVAAKAKSPNWKIHRSILRPTMNNWERLGFFHKGMAYLTDVGVEGGVVLIEYDPTDPALPVTYFYTDIYVITAIALGHVVRDGKTVKAAKTLRKNLPSKKLTDKISVPRGMFIKVATASHLLAMLSMHCAERINWQNRIVTAGQENDWGPKGQILPSALAKIITEIPDAMKKASGVPKP